MPHTIHQFLEHERRVAGMYADPECVGDLLLIGLVFARAVDFGDPPLDQVVKHAARMVYGNANHGHQLHDWGRKDEIIHNRVVSGGVGRVKGVLHSDIRRYEPDLSKAYSCQRPIRPRTVPAGAPTRTQERRCGRGAWSNSGVLLVDPVDGTRHAMGVCNQDRCQAWWKALKARNDAELATHPAPEPVANRGGVLERHLDELDWPRLYTHLDPTWKPPHETPGWRPPKLQIVIGDDQEDSTTERPALTVVKGGWTP